MNKNLIATSTISIYSTPQKIWDILTDPIKIEAYLYGTKIKTDWKKGNPISFEGEYEGKKYHDKGVIIDYQRLQTLTYSYWSTFSGLEDITKNYAIITYQLKEQGEGVYIFTWNQKGFASEEGKCHTEKELNNMLQEIKKLAEE